MACYQICVCRCDSLQKFLINTILCRSSIGAQRRFDSGKVRLQQSWKSYLLHPVTFTDVCERTVYLLYRYSLQIVLNPSWRPTSRLSKSLKAELCHLYTKSSSLIVKKLCYKLKKIVLKPWKHPILKTIICPCAIEMNDRRVAKYFRDEGEAMIWTRMEVLCENSAVIGKILKNYPLHRTQSENISPALSYITEVLWYLTNKGEFLDKAQNIDVLCAGCPLDIRDAFLALLAREGKIDAMRHYMYENMSLHAVTKMKERIRNWPGCLPPSLACQACTVDFHASEVSAGIALSNGKMGQQLPLLKMVGWELALGSKNLAWNGKALSRRARALAKRAKMLATAESQPIHIFVLANRLSRMKFWAEYRSICLELYLMGLNLELSRRMDTKSDETAIKQKTTINPILASVFGRLAKLFNTQWLVKREILLTAFSLHPNRQWFKELLLVARQSGKTCSARGCTVPFFDSWCQNTAAHILCSTCGRYGTHGNVHSRTDTGSLVWYPLPENVISNSLMELPRCHMLDNKSLTIKRNLAEQLVSLVSAFRYKELSWVLEWSQLYTLCVNYMDTEDRGRNKNNDLIFAKMDYPLYQCLKEDNKIVPVKRKRKRTEEDCTDSVNKRGNYRCNQERKEMNINNYRIYKTRIDALDDILSMNNIMLVSSEVCDIFEIEDTATGFERLRKIRRAMMSLYENSTEDTYSSYLIEENLRTKIKNFKETRKMDVQDLMAC